MSNIVRKEKKEVARGSVSLKKWLTYTGIFAAAIFVIACPDLGAKDLADKAFEFADSGVTKWAKRAYKLRFFGIFGIPAAIELWKYFRSSPKASLGEIIPELGKEVLYAGGIVWCLAETFPTIVR